ncbi:MAG: alpha/beta family hydrolase, partial [Gammaproteobacteria bacterium]
MARFLIDGPAKAKLTLVLAHGAGAAMDSPFMTTIAESVAAEGVKVVRFEFPYMQR